MPEFWYSIGSTVVMVYAWLTDDMALGISVSERHETVFPKIIHRDVLDKYYERRDEEPWFFPNAYNDWVHAECEF